MLRAELAARLLPSTELTEELYRATGRVDFGEAAVAARDEGRLDGARVLVTSGMWGGYAAIAAARRPLRERLLDVPGARALAASATAGAGLTVGLHVRRGDFGGPGPSAGTFNRPVPTGWFVSVVHALQEQLGDASYVVCTDAGEGALPELTGLPQVRVVRGDGSGRAGAGAGRARGAATCSSARSPASRCWRRSCPTGRTCGSGRSSPWSTTASRIWGREPAQRSADSPTRQVARPALRARARSGHPRPRVRSRRAGPPPTCVTPEGGWDRRRDLLYYGAVPGGPADTDRLTAHEGGDPT